MNKQEEYSLWESYNKTRDKALKKELIHSLTPLIKSQVGKYANSGLPYYALELEGRKLTSKAIDTFDPTKGAQLNTHVTTYLKKLSRYTNSYQNVGHIPEPRALMLGKYETIFSNLEAEKGREPTVEELSDSMQISQREVQRIQLERRNDLHMELPSSDPEEGGFSYYISPDSEDPKINQAIQFVYFDASPVDKKILEYTFGLGGTQKITASEIKLKLRLKESELRARKEDLSKKIKEII